MQSPADEIQEAALELSDAAALARAIIDKTEHVRGALADNADTAQVFNGAVRICELAELIEEIAGKGHAALTA